MNKNSNKDKDQYKENSLGKKLTWERPEINEMRLSDSEGGGSKKFTSTENPGGQYQPQVNPS